MKICLVAHNLDQGAGLGRMVFNIARELRDRGHDVGFVLGSDSSEKNFIKIDFSFSKSNPIRHFWNLLRVRKFLNNYEYVVCYDVRPSAMITCLASIGIKNKIIIHSLGTYSLFVKRAFLKNLLMSFSYRKAFRVFVINEFVKRKILESNNKFTFSDSQVFVPVGVQTENFLRKTESPPLVQGKYFLSVGAIKRRKGQLEVLKAFSKVKPLHPNLKYVVVGNFKDSLAYYQEMVSFAKKNKLTDSVLYIEGVDDTDLINLYTYSEFFILTPVSTDKYIEGFGMVYIESALCGKTAIGTLDTGAEAALEHMKTGLLVESNEDSIANAMQKLLSDNILRQELEKNAYARALTFDWSNVVDLYEKNF